MRLGLVIYGELNTVSGGFLYDRKLVEFLRREGHEVRIFSLPWRSYGLNLATSVNHRLLRDIDAAGLELLLEDELNHPSLLWVNRRLSLPKVAIVHHLRSSEARPAWQNAFYRWIEKKFLGSVQAAIYTSHVTRAVVEALLGDRPPGIVAHPAADHFDPGPDRDQIRARVLRSGPLEVLFIGNLTARKGLHTLIDALTRLKPGSWRLTVIGDPYADIRYTRRLRKMILKRQLSAWVKFIGPQHGPAIAAHLRRAHTLAVPSSYEGFGIVYLEAMAYGLPPLAGAAGGANDFVRHAENGFLIPPDRADLLADHLQALGQDRKRLLELALAAKADFERHPTWETSLQSIQTFLVERILS